MCHEGYRERHDYRNMNRRTALQLFLACLHVKINPTVRLKLSRATPAICHALLTLWQSNDTWEIILIVCVSQIVDINYNHTKNCLDLLFTIENYCFDDITDTVIATSAFSLLREKTIHHVRFYPTCVPTFPKMMIVWWCVISSIWQRFRYVK